MPTGELSADVYRELLAPEKFAEWEHQQETRREFWRTLQGPAKRPLESNADEWHLFLCENKDNLCFLAVQIAEAIDEAEQRGAKKFIDRANLSNKDEA
jgi:hypothetical protein